MMNVSSCGLRVLVADDDPCFRAMICMALENHGFTTAQARDGKEALCLFQLTKNSRTESFDAVITDYDMPHMNGLEVIRSLRSEDENIPVVLITGGIPEDDLLALLVYERFAAVSKPFCPSRLVTATRHVLSTPMTRTSAPKRKDARLPIEISCTIKECGTAHIQNLSVGGAFIETEHPAEVNSKISIHFKNFTLKAEVRWNHSHGMGVRFIQMNEKMRQAIRDILTHHLTQKKAGWFH